MIPRRALLSLPLLAACRQPGAGFRGHAFVASSTDPSLVSIDLLAFAVKARLTLPSPANSLHLSRGRLFAFCPDARALAVIDPKSLAITSALKLPADPLTAIRRHGALHLLLRHPNQLLSIPLDTLRPARPINLPATPTAFDIATAGPHAVIAFDDNSIAFADLDTRLLHPPLAIDDTLGAVRFRSDGNAAFAAGLARRQLIVLDARVRAVMTQLPLSLSPDHLCMNPDGGQIFITGRGRDAVAIAYAYRTEIAQTSLSGRKPGEMAASATPNLLFVSNPEAGSVTIFDVTTQKVVAVTGVGLDPGPIYITPDQQFALVLNRASGDLAVIRIAAITPGRSKSAPLFTMIPVGPHPTAAVIAAS